MSKRKLQPTSLEAYSSLNKSQLNKTYQKILEALQIIRKGHYEDIARQARLEPDRVWKRLSELAKDELIHRTGERKMLSSKRVGSVWALTEGEKPQIETEKAIPGKSVADFSRALIQPNPKQFIQEKLF